MEYEISVLLNGKPFFTTNEKSIQKQEDLRFIVPVFLEKFPKEEGYKVSVTLWERTGEHISTEEIVDFVI